jgi:hypothetical protein
MVSATLYVDERDQSATLVLRCQGVRHGHLMTLWRFSLALPEPITGPSDALRAIAQGSLAALGDQIVRE